MAEQIITPIEFINKHKLWIIVSEVRRNPNIDASAWDKNARHYDVTIGRGPSNGPRMHVYFTKGSALPRGVRLEEVLDCLASDACGYDNAGSFENWASEYGYDTDSIKAKAIYELIGRQSKDLKELLGYEAYAELLYEVGRL